MVNKFKLTVVHCTPKWPSKPNADLCMLLDLLLDKKLWKIRTGPPGCRAIAGCGPLGRGGPWAVGRGPQSGPSGRGPAFSKTLLKIVQSVWLYSCTEQCIIVPRDDAPFGKQQESRPLASSNDIPVLNGLVNTIDWDQDQSDLSDLTLSTRRVMGSPVNRGLLALDQARGCDS